MFKPDSYLTTLFYRLREDGFNLSIREYFSAKDAIKEGWGTKNKEDFKKLLRLLWCNSWEQQDHLALIFDTIVIESEKTEKKTTDKPKETRKSPNNDQINLDSSSTISSTQSIEIPSTVATKPATQELYSLPITTPKPIH